MYKVVRLWKPIWLKSRFYFDHFLAVLRIKKSHLKFPILFIHIPKTGGTSFRIMLFKKISQSNIFPNWKDIARNGGEYPDLQQTVVLSESMGKKIPSLIFGHLPFALKSILPTDFKCFLFLREPISRTISNLLHFQRSNPEYQKLSLEEIFIKNKKHLQNLQTRYLCDTIISNTMVFNHKRELGELALVQAKNNLEKCTFIGITEKFEQSIKVGEKILEIELGKTVFKNVSSINKKVAHLDPKLVSVVKPHLTLDIQLYQHALHLFELQQSRILKE